MELAFAAPFGLVIGSFLNVVAYRLPRGESLVAPPSHCPGCEAPIRPWDNVPLLSWIFLRGRCRSCGEHLEVVQSFKDEPLTVCPTCDGELRKVFSPIGISFKGSGFYKTDSRSGGGKKSESSTSETKSDSKSESKSESKSSDSSGSSSSSSKSESKAASA